MKHIECQHCGKQNIPDTEKRCPQCGFDLSSMSDKVSSPLDEKTAGASNANNGNAQTSKSIKVNAAAVVGLLVGIVFIITGIVIINDAEIIRFRENYMGLIGHLGDITFGGDFYTEVYNGIEECEEDLANIGSALVKLTKAVGALVCGVGASTAAMSLTKIKK